MGRQGSASDDLQQDTFTVCKYGMPIYGLSWQHGDTFYVGGGGGATASGIRNKIVAAKCMQGMLTDQVGEVDFEKDCVMRLAVAPNGKTAVVAMADGGLSRVDIDDNGRHVKLIKATGDIASKLTFNKVRFKPLAFNSKGDVLVAGGEQFGDLLVVRWPTLEVKLQLKGDDKLSDSVRDIHVAPGPRSTQFVLVLDNASCEVWDWEQKQCICRASLQTRGELMTDTCIAMTGPGNASVQQLPQAMTGSKFINVRYITTPATPINPPHQHSTPAPSTSSSHSPTQLYALMTNRNGSWMTVWQQHPTTGMLSLQRWRNVANSPSSTMAVSPDGQLIAVGTADQEVLVLEAATFRTLVNRPKAHTVFITNVAFSPDNKYVLSASGDSSATATSTQPPPAKPINFARIVQGILLLCCALMTILVAALRILKAQGRHDIVDIVKEVFPIHRVVEMVVQAAGGSHSEL